MSFQIERSKVRVRLYGKEYDLTKPTIGEVDSLQEQIDDAKGDESKQYKLMKVWMGNRGLSEDVINSLEVDHFIELCEFLTGKKK